MASTARLHVTTAVLLLALSRCTLAAPYIDYSALPSTSVFSGPWQQYVQAPTDKSHIEPANIWAVSGNVAAPGGVTTGEYAPGTAITMGPGGTITFEFAQNIGGL